MKTDKNTALWEFVKKVKAANPPPKKRRPVVKTGDLPIRSDHDVRPPIEIERDMPECDPKYQ